MSAAEKDHTDRGLSGYVEIRYLDPERSRFDETPGGFLSLTLDDGTHCPRVYLYRSFPFTLGDEYISVRDSEGKEIGLIRRVSDFPADVQERLREELERRYFMPAITAIRSVKEEFGYAYWDVETESGPRRFTVKDSQQNILFLSPEHVLIVDVDGNRFEIPDWNRLDPSSRRFIENLF